MTTGFSEPGYRYQLILRGECGPLTVWLSGDVAIESGDGWTSVISQSGTTANSTACSTRSRTCAPPDQPQPDRQLVPWTMNRLAAMQDSPLFRQRATAATSAAWAGPRTA